MTNPVNVIVVSDKLGKITGVFGCFYQHMSGLTGFKVVFFFRDSCSLCCGNVISDYFFG